ncbi:ComE1 [Neisseria meningitidis]|nr:ComE1 [Neisseria meningitidis]
MKKMFVLFCMLFSCAFSLAAVNINAASQQELEALPGIGPAKAKAIAEYAKRCVQVCRRFDQGKGHRPCGAGEAEGPGFGRRARTKRPS